MLAAALRGLTVLLLVMLTLLPAGCQARARRPVPEPVLAPSRPAGSLQEVAPPGAVQQLQQGLAGHQPRVIIQSPANDSLLPAGPWELTVAVEDWPLVNAGPLGLGPHLTLQLDGEPAIRLTGDARPFSVSMAPLSPGSHRLTVYAAFPWGEALKQPGASQQIRLHRVAPNQLALPAEGSPQLIPVATVRANVGQPALVDWMVLDAPLQHLRDRDDRWRLRVTVNGDSFLLDRQAPLWLRGLQKGSNAIVLELLDPAGQPLNPPFNSIVQEVVLESDPPSGWQLETLVDGDLQRLLGATALADATETQGPDPTLAPAARAAPLSPPPESGPAQPVEAAPQAPPPVPPTPASTAATAPITPPQETAGAQPDPVTPTNPVVPITESADSMSPPVATAQPGPPAHPGIQPAPPIEPVEPVEPTSHPPASASETKPNEPTPQPPTPRPSEPATGLMAPRPLDQVSPDGIVVTPQNEGLLGRLRARFAG